MEKSDGKKGRTERKDGDNVGQFRLNPFSLLLTFKSVFGIRTRIFQSVVNIRIRTVPIRRQHSLLLIFQSVSE